MVPWEVVATGDPGELFWVIPAAMLVIALLVVVVAVVRGEVRTRRRWRARLRPLPEDVIDAGDGGLPVAVFLIFLTPLPVLFLADVLLRGRTVEGAVVAAASFVLLVTYCCGIGFTVVFVRAVVERIWKLPGTR